MYIYIYIYTYIYIYIYILYIDPGRAAAVELAEGVATLHVAQLGLSGACLHQREPRLRTNGVNNNRVADKSTQRIHLKQTNLKNMSKEMQ